ncbi:ArnT family glycosyltransferase [Frigoriglobus tundricola]|uniref:Glycosyltransferase RgtA/B/C/D-like domain-containing protein n=1 Tax=Frigoriglobus tundricola TaxID=2774151 RepID=A0A6M5YZD3_9BACT|nr:glycosyltransferase family 39 protein [Frigoriglobus tundricola]QJW98894.1 hypothetical protein FTUN_6489 [Frigoriglobus tundricola]
MSSTVGGRLEAVERPRTLFGPDYLRLAVLALVAVAAHGWLVGHTALTARDSLGFARLALCFENPSAAPPFENGRPKNTLDHIREAEQPPGYPLAVWAVDVALRSVSSRPTPDRVLLAAQLANALAAVLLVIPTYLIGRMLFTRNVGFAAALLFQVLPVPLRITSDGLTEGVYLLATGVAIMLAVRAVRRPGIGAFLLCGVATGASYLVRPEGLLVAAGPAAVVLYMGISRLWPRDAAFGRFVALLIGVLLVSVPYMALIGKFTNKPTGTYLNPVGDPSVPLFKGGLPVGAQRAVTGAPLFAEWWNNERDAGRSRLLWAFQAVFKEASKSANYVVWPLALFAVLALRRKFATEPGLWVLSVLVGCNLALLVYLAARVGYVSERHTVLLTMLACQLAAGGLPLLAAALGQLLPRVERLGVRITAASLLVALVASALPFALKPMHPQREGHKRAGLWIASHITDNDAMIDPYNWAEWYAGRTLYRTSWNPPKSKNNYVVLENELVKTGPHSRLPVLPEAQRLSKQSDSRIVYHWPENVPQKDAVIYVYKLGPD